MRWETKGHFIFGTLILGFLSIFKNSQASLPFETFNSACLSRCQRDMRPPVHMRWRPNAFSSVSTGNSDIPSYCEVKDKPTFKPLQGNPAFFGVRTSRVPFHLRKKTQGPSHISIAEGKFLLSCLWKVGLILQSKTGNWLSSRDDMVCMEFYSSCCTEIDVPLDLRRVSQGISGVS